MLITRELILLQNGSFWYVCRYTGLKLAITISKWNIVRKNDGKVSYVWVSITHKVNVIGLM